MSFQCSEGVEVLSQYCLSKHLPFKIRLVSLAWCEKHLSSDPFTVFYCIYVWFQIDLCWNQILQILAMNYHLMVQNRPITSQKEPHLLTFFVVISLKHFLNGRTRHCFINYTTICTKYTLLCFQVAQPVHAVEALDAPEVQEAIRPTQQVSVSWNYD